jgi:hypothetical protein
MNWKSLLIDMAIVTGLLFVGAALVGRHLRNARRKADEFAASHPKPPRPPEEPND